MSGVTIRNKFFEVKNDLVKIVGDGPMYDQQITKICKDLFGKDYLGTFSQDQIPVEKKGFCIINVDTSKQDGTHWVALVFKGSKCYVYDTFGRNVKKLLPILRKKLENHKIIEIATDPHPEQYGNTNVCGQLCIAFLFCVRKYGIDHVVKII